jgi:hypothetical protein
MVFLIQKVTLPTIKLIKFIILATIVCFCAFASYAQNPVTKPPVLIKDSVTYTDTIFLGLYKTAFLEIKGRETKSVNIGQQSDDIEIGQQDTLPVTMLRVLKANFQETNLTVFLEDTTLQFLVVFAMNPSRTYYSYTLQGKESPSSTMPLPATPIESQSAGTVSERSALKMDSVKVENEHLFARINVLEKNFQKGDVNKGKKIEVRRMYVMGKKLYLGFIVDNSWKGALQIGEILTELIHSGSGTKEIIKTSIQDAALKSINPFSKSEFAISMPFIRTELGDKLKITLKTSPENNLPDYVIEITNRDFNLAKYIKEEDNAAKGKKK